MASDSGNCCCGGIIFFFIGIGLLIYGAQRFLLYQKIKNTPTSKVRSAAVGLVELFGKARCATDLSSPVTGAKCIYYRIIGQYYKPGKNGGWKNIYNDASSVKFFLEDETGKMLIDPKDGEIDIPSDLVLEGHLTDKGFLGMHQNKLDARVLAFLEKNPDAKKKFEYYKDHNLKVFEYFIAEGDPLYVLGTAEPLKGASSDISYENLIVGKGKSDIGLYISDSGEKTVLGSMVWGIAGSIVGGLVLSVLGLIFILTNIG